MTNEEHAAKLDFLADYGITSKSSRPALRAGAAALRNVEVAKAALEHAMRIFATNGLSSKGIDRIAAALAQMEEA